MRSHPRPLLTRKHWIDLDGEWHFKSDRSDVGVDDGWWRGDIVFDQRIIVPFPPESTASGLAEDGHAIVWYRRELDLERPFTGQRVILHFGAVDYAADVWVNGAHVARHEGGHVSFHTDITPAMQPGPRQTIVVRAHDEVAALDQPRGKQDWEPEPHVIWYRRTTGIWRQVWAEILPAMHIEHARWTPLPRPGQVQFEAWVTPLIHDDAALTIELRHGDAIVHRATLPVIEGQVSAVLHLRDPRLDAEPDRLLWTPERPHLLDATLRLIHDGVSVDDASSYVGLRTVSTHGGAVQLNGRPYYLRLALEQAYWPHTHLASPSDEAIQQEVSLIKALGFNGVRIHQTVADPRFLEQCDRQGLVVWADAPAAYRFSAHALARTVNEWTQIVHQDASHPSVIAWVAFNESWGVPDVATDATQQNAVRALYFLLKTLDPSRLVIGNDGWEFVAGDFLGIHDYTQDPQAIAARYGDRGRTLQTVETERPGARRLKITPGAISNIPVVLSEFGGTGYTADPDSWQGYGAVDDSLTFVHHVEELVSAARSATGLAGFCYTQLTDTAQERNGLLDEQRVPKASVKRLRQIFGSEATVRHAQEESRHEEIGPSSSITTLLDNPTRLFTPAVGMDVKASETDPAS